MTPRDRLQIDLAAAQYLEAFEAGDPTTLERLWADASGDAELLEAYRETHDGLLEEQAAGELDAATSAIADAVMKHLPSGKIDRTATGPVTVGDVARELFRDTTAGFSAAARQLSERLRLATEELPDNLGLSALVAWAEAKFGPGDIEYWKAFRHAAITLDLRRSAECEYYLAARAAPKPEGLK